MSELELIVSEVTCWSCSSDYKKGKDVCPNCGASAEKDEDDLDSFLDSALETTTSKKNDDKEIKETEESKQEQEEKLGSTTQDQDEGDIEPAFPDFDYIEGKSEESKNIYSSDDPKATKAKEETKQEEKTPTHKDISTTDEPSLPDFDYIEGESSSSENEYVDSQVKEDEEQSQVSKADEKSTPDTDEPSMPDFNYIEGKADSSENVYHDDQEEELQKKPDKIDTDVKQSDVETERKVESRSEEETEKRRKKDKSAMLADIDAMLEDTEPQIQETKTETKSKTADRTVSTPEEQQQTPKAPKMVDEETPKEGRVEIERESILAKGFGNALKIYTTQGIYWSIVFLVISLTSVEATSQNIILEILKPNSYTIQPEGVVLGWIAFIPMAFFFSYKLRKENIKPKYHYLLILYLTNLIIIGIISLIGLVIINPTLFQTGFLSKRVILSLYFYMMPILYIFDGITAGFIIGIFIFKKYWDRIYELTPQSYIKPELAKD